MESSESSVEKKISDSASAQRPLSLLKKVNSHKRFVKDYITVSGIHLLRETRKGNVDHVVDLLCRGAPFISDSTGVSPLHYAAYNGSLEITELLLNSGMLRDLKNKVDRTPLHIAAQLNHIDIVKALLSYGADPNVVDMINMTPLHWAVEGGNVECVKLLLQYGATIITSDNFGRSPLDIAMEGESTEIIYILENKNSMFKIPDNSTDNDRGDEEMEINEDLCDSREEKQEEPEKNLIEEVHHIKEKTNSACDNATSSPNKLLTTQSFANIDKDTLEMLKLHGIQMLEPDKATTIHSAVQNGQKVVLTEAGKLALDTISKSESVKFNASSSTSVIIQNGRKSIKINTGQLTSLDLEKGKPFLKKVGPAHSVRYFEGRQYSEDEDHILTEKLRSAIDKLRREGKLLDIFAKRKFRQANVYNHQLLSLIYINKKQRKFSNLNCE